MFTPPTFPITPILIVDDMPSNIRVLREAVKDLGEIYFATSGESALEMARTCRPAVILLDIEMPGMDGYAVCTALKSDPSTSDSSIIFVTSHDSDPHELHALELGGVDFIQKPLNVPITRARVQTQLLLQRKTRLLAQARRDLADLVETLPAFIAYWDANLLNVFCNDVDGIWFGVNADKMHQQHLEEAVGSANFHLVQPFIERVISGQNPSFEMMFTNVGRAAIYGQVSLVYRRDEEEKTDGFLMLVTDTTERKLAEMALYDEKERMRVTLNSIGDAVIATDPEGLVTFVNPIAEDLTGWMMSEAVGKPIETIMPLSDGGTGHKLFNPIRLAITERRIVGMALDCVLHRRDGKEFAVEDSAAPIRNHNGEITGAIIVFHDVSEARAMATKMTHLAQHDALTNLPNKILLRDRTDQALKKAQRNESKVAMILLDIDHFKTINDHYGHSVGDQLLQQIAQSLSKISRNGDTVCRQGGDEFIILLTDIASTESLADFASRVLKVFSQTWYVGQQPFNLSISLGISLFPDDSVDMDSLYRHADVAMYAAKQQGRNRYQFFSEDIENQLRTRHALEEHLREALKNNVFEVFYQPKVDALNQSIVGAEALVRWRKSDGQIVLPGTFIPLAEETGLIIPLGKLILHQACTQAKKWSDEGLAIKVAVNISVVQFEDVGFIESVAGMLAQTGVDPTQIELEITESLLAQNTDKTSQSILRLKALGLAIALDDFGTGYSSLSYLKLFSLDVLKIDQSFVRDMLDDEIDLAIVKAVIAMAIGLRLDLVAEGVETKAHVNMLRSLGCHILQGYYFSRPLPLVDMEKVLRNGLPIASE